MRCRHLSGVAVIVLMQAAGHTMAGTELKFTNTNQPESVLPSDFTVDLNFLTDGTTPSLVGYDIGLMISGPGTGLTITGAASGVNRPAGQVLSSDPTFFTQPVSGNTLFMFSDFLLSGSGTISNGSQLLRLKLHADAGTTGTYSVNFFTDGSSPLQSKLYADELGTPVPNLSMLGGTVSFVPEPALLSLVVPAVWLLRRRSRIKRE